MDWNGVVFVQRENSCDRLGTLLRSRVVRGAKVTEMGHEIQIASINIRSGCAGGVECSTLITEARQCWYWIPTVDEADWGYPRSIEHRLQGMVDGVR